MMMTLPSSYAAGTTLQPRFVPVSPPLAIPSDGSFAYARPQNSQPTAPASLLPTATPQSSSQQNQHKHFPATEPGGSFASKANERSGWLKPSRKLSFSDTLAQLDAHQVSRVRIHQNPNPFSGLPEADVYLANGTIGQVTLSPEGEELLSRKLLDQHVPFEFQSAHDRLGKQISAFTLDMVKDCFMPLVLIGGTLLATPKLGDWMTNAQVRAQMGKALKNAVKPLETLYNVEAIQSQYAKPVVEAIERFRKGRLSVMFLQGPPGTGKTHLMNGLLAEMGKQKNVLTLNGEEGPDVLNTLRSLYLSNAETQHKTFSAMRRHVGREFDTIVLYINEAEKDLYRNDMEELIVKGIGNAKSQQRVVTGNWFERAIVHPIQKRFQPDFKPPEATFHLPELKIVATTNDLIQYDFAARSRISQEGLVFVDHMSPKAMATIARNEIRKAFPKQWTTEKEQKRLLGELESTLYTHRGFSTRRLHDLLREAIQEAKEPPKPHPERPNVMIEAKPVLTIFRRKLSKTGMDPAEMAGLIRREVVEHMTEIGTERGYHLNKQQLYDLERTAWRKAEEQAKNALQDMQLSLTPQDIRRTVRLAMSEAKDGGNRYTDFVAEKADQEPLMPQDAADVIKNVAEAIKQRPYKYAEQFGSRLHQQQLKEMAETLYSKIGSNSPFEEALRARYAATARYHWGQTEQNSLEDVLRAYQDYMPNVMLNAKSNGKALDAINVQLALKAARENTAIEIPPENLQRASQKPFLEALKRHFEVVEGGVTKKVESVAAQEEVASRLDGLLPAQSLASIYSSSPEGS
jgi:hypothetical protein